MIIVSILYLLTLLPKMKIIKLSKIAGDMVNYLFLRF
jgi:hypothetical protein